MDGVDHSAETDPFFSPIKELLFDSIPAIVYALLNLLFFVFLALIIPKFIAWVLYRCFHFGPKTQSRSGAHLERTRHHRDHPQAIIIDYNDVGSAFNNLIRLIYFIIQLVFIFFGIAVFFHLLGVEILHLLAIFGVLAVIGTYGTKDLFSNVCGCICNLSENIIDINDIVQIGSFKFKVDHLGSTHVTGTDTTTGYRIVLPNCMLVTNPVIIQCENENTPAGSISNKNITSIQRRSNV